MRWLTNRNKWKRVYVVDSIPFSGICLAYCGVFREDVVYYCNTIHVYSGINSGLHKSSSPKSNGMSHVRFIIVVITMWKKKKN